MTFVIAGQDDFFDDRDLLEFVTLRRTNKIAAVMLRGQRFKTGIVHAAKSAARH